MHPFYFLSIMCIFSTAVHCPQIPSSPGLHVSNPSTKMDTKVVFSCRGGQTLLGAEEATCFPSGNWSEEAPTCRGKYNYVKQKLLDISPI